jgi:hypothetical protein
LIATASPAPAGRAAPSGYLMAALALVVVAPLALAGWLAGRGGHP